MAASNITIVGTQIKFALSLSLPDRLSMDNVDFAATFYTVSNRCVVISKRDMIRQDDGTYVCIVDTDTLGAGRIKCEVEALLPDSSMADGTATNIYVSVTTDKKGEDSCGMNNLVSASYTIRKGEEKIWTGTIQVPQAFRNKVLYIHVFADGYHFFNGQVIPEFPGRE